MTDLATIEAAIRGSAYSCGTEADLQAGLAEVLAPLGAEREGAFR